MPELRCVVPAYAATGLPSQAPKQRGASGGIQQQQRIGLGYGVGR